MHIGTSSPAKQSCAHAQGACSHAPQELSCTACSRSSFSFQRAYWQGRDAFSNAFNTGFCNAIRQRVNKPYIVINIICPWPGVRTSRYPGHSGRRPPSLSASLCRTPSPLSSSSGTEPLTAPPKDAAFSSLSCIFSISLFLSAFAGSFEVTVTSVSLPPFVSRRGLSNTNQRLSQVTSTDKLG